MQVPIQVKQLKKKNKKEEAQTVAGVSVMWRDGDRYVKAYQVQTERFKSTNVEWISDGN